jgi:hypothetical protein
MQSMPWLKIFSDYYSLLNAPTKDRHNSDSRNLNCRMSLNAQIDCVRTHTCHCALQVLEYVADTGTEKSASESEPQDVVRCALGSAYMCEGLALLASFSDAEAATTLSQCRSVSHESSRPWV